MCDQPSSKHCHVVWSCTCKFVNRMRLQLSCCSMLTFLQHNQSSCSFWLTLTSIFWRCNEWVLSLQNSATFLQHNQSSRIERNLIFVHSGWHWHHPSSKDAMNERCSCKTSDLPCNKNSGCMPACECGAQRDKNLSNQSQLVKHRWTMLWPNCIHSIDDEMKLHFFLWFLLPQTNNKTCMGVVTKLTIFPWTQHACLGPIASNNKKWTITKHRFWKQSFSKRHKLSFSTLHLCLTTMLQVVNLRICPFSWQFWQSSFVCFANSFTCVNDDCRVVWAVQQLCTSSKELQIKWNATWNKFESWLFGELKKNQTNVSLQSNLTAALRLAIFQISEIEVLSPSAAGFDKHNWQVLLGLNCARCRFSKTDPGLENVFWFWCWSFKEKKTRADNVKRRRMQCTERHRAGLTSGFDSRNWHSLVSRKQSAQALQIIANQKECCSWKQRTHRQWWCQNVACPKWRLSKLTVAKRLQDVLFCLAQHEPSWRRQSFPIEWQVHKTHADS